MKFRLGDASRNLLLDIYNQDAAYRQTPAEHEQLLKQFIRPGMTPDEEMRAIEAGILAEKQSPKYWDDETPRVNLGGSSSWIDEIEYIPSLGIAVMNTNGKEYYYPMTADEVGDWMTSESLGSYYNHNIKLKQ